METCIGRHDDVRSIYHAKLLLTVHGEIFVADCALSIMINE